MGEHGRPGVNERLAEAADLYRRWAFAEAREVLVGVLSDALADGAVDSLPVITGRRMLVEVLRELGELAEARAVGAPLVVECVARYGETHPATVRALASLARVLHDEGDLDAAERMYRRVLDGRVSEDGPAGRPVRITRANLARLFRDRGQRGPATSLLTAAYAVHRRAYGVADPETVRISVELASMHLAAGELAAARRLLTVAYAGCAQRLGDSHPLTRAVEAELAAVEPAAPPQDVPAPGAGQGRFQVPTGDAGSVRRARRRRPRGWLRVLIPVAGLVALVAVLVVAQLDRVPPRLAAVGPGAAAPGRSGDHRPPVVRLDDTGAAITVRWLDPPDGPAPIVIALAEAGKPAQVVATLPAGARRYVLGPVDPDRDYCVIVGAVYPGAALASATSVCTRRAGAGAGTSASAAPRPPCDCTAVTTRHR
jgi:hypothetical protein